MTKEKKGSMFEQEICEHVWREKYCYGDEKSPEESFARVVSGVYKNDSRDHAEQALELMEQRVWMPAGRIHAAIGTDKRATGINCYVSPTIEDSMETEIDDNSKGIMDALKVAALTQQMGGGIGMNFDLRPRGAIVRRAASVAGGNLYFMDMWHAMCNTVMSSGSRRGAMMATMRVDHPDIEEFIEAKHQKGRLTNFNVSVLVTDEFMEAVRNDWHWYLHYPVIPASGEPLGTLKKDGKTSYVYKRVPARELWDKIVRSTFEYSEPGVIFIDRVNKWNNLSYCEKIVATNPCGEQPLPPNGDCNLGHINLAACVKNPFTEHAHIAFELIARATHVGVRFLDNVLDVTHFPTEDQRKEALDKRRIGLGITGLANMFQQLRIRYGSPLSVEVAEEVMHFICQRAYGASANLAKERGSFPRYESEPFLSSPFVRERLATNVWDEIEKTGIRNGVLLTIAPTGTTSLYYDNVSSGCEPVFSHSAKRKVLQADGSYKEFIVEDWGYKLYCKIATASDLFSVDPLPDYMVQAHDLTVDDHLAIQAACQKYVDSSISKTINCPPDISFDEFKDVYTKAYNLGLKGVTTYRPSEVRGSVLSTVVEGKTAESERSAPSKEKSEPTIRQRDNVLSGKTYKLRWQGVEHAFYVTINDDAEGHPFEVFINTKSAVHSEWIHALTRLISAIFRKGGDPVFMIEELKQVHAMTGGYFVDKKYVPSLVALIGETIEKHMQRNTGAPSSNGVSVNVSVASPNEPPVFALACPKCLVSTDHEGKPSYVKKEGCAMCANCGYSNCGG